MKQAIRALGWGANIFWIMLLFFAATIVYSASQLGFGFPEEPSTSTQNENLTLSLPFQVSNGGFYDVSNLNVTTQVNDENGSFISNSFTLVQLIPRGSNVSVTHNISISLDKMTTENLSYLLFNDSVFNVDVALKMNFANAIPCAVSTNFSLPWGAPISDLTIGNILIASPINTTHISVNVPLGFENHSVFGLNGTITLQLISGTNQLAGEGTVNFNTPSQSRYEDAVELATSGNPENIKEVRLFFETPLFRYGPVVIPLV